MKLDDIKAAIARQAARLAQGVLTI